VRSLSLLGICCLLLTTGCGPMLGIVRTRPAPVNLSPARDVSVEVQARSIAPAEALLVPIKAAGIIAATGTLDGELRQQLSRAQSKFRVVAPQGAQCRLGVTVTDWSQDVVEQQGSRPGTHGASSANPNTPPPPPRRELRAELISVLNATCAHRGQQVMTREFRASRSLELSPSLTLLGAQSRALEDVTQEVARDISNAITPTEYADYVPLDDGEKALEPMVRRIQDGQLAVARTDLEGYLSANPQSAGAHYNLGVLDEADGNLESARHRYEQARNLQAKDLYAQGIERVARVLGEQAALAGQAP
jgi:hypothetical protein